MDKDTKPSAADTPGSMAQERDDAQTIVQQAFDHLICPSQDLTFDYAQASFASAGLSWDRSTLIRLHLTKDVLPTQDATGDAEDHATKIDANERPYTNTALLISDQCPYRIKCAVFSGQTKSDLKERRDFTGSVLRQIDEAMVFLNGRNDGQDAFPTDALRESLVNAVLHRDYEMNGPTLISVFDSRVEFVSLGGLYGGLQVNDLLNGVSETRNPWLAGVFEALGLSENLGTGVQRILDLYAESMASPQVRVGPASVAMVLPKPVLSQDWPQPRLADGAFGGEPGILSDDDEHPTGEDDTEHTAKRYIFPPARRDLTHDPSAALAGARVISASPLAEAMEPLTTLVLSSLATTDRGGSKGNASVGGDATNETNEYNQSNHFNQSNHSNQSNRYHQTQGDSGTGPHYGSQQEIEVLEEITLHLLAQQGTVLSRAQIGQSLRLNDEKTTIVLKALTDKGALDEHVQYSIAQR